MDLLTLFDLPETLESMSDAEILNHYRPYLHIIRPENKPTLNDGEILTHAQAADGRAKRSYIKTPSKEQANLDFARKMAQQFGLDLPI